MCEQSRSTNPLLSKLRRSSPFRSPGITGLIAPARCRSRSLVRTGRGFLTLIRRLLPSIETLIDSFHEAVFRGATAAPRRSFSTPRIPATFSTIEHDGTAPEQLYVAALLFCRSRSQTWAPQPQALRRRYLLALGIRSWREPVKTQQPLLLERLRAHSPACLFPVSPRQVSPVRDHGSVLWLIPIDKIRMMFPVSHAACKVRAPTEKRG